MVTGSEALERLIEGNRRFVDSMALNPRRDAARRCSVALRQEPVAAVLCCSDSRVSPEILFDQGLGDIFVTRTAGNVADAAVIGSLEYAAAHLQVPLIVVLGHTGCGAVKEALVHAEKTDGHIGSITAAIRPSIAVPETNGSSVDHTAKMHALRTAGLLRNMAPVLRSRCEQGKLRVATAMYDLHSGAVEMLS
jgi:carbonic anhydrase